MKIAEPLRVLIVDSDADCTENIHTALKSCEDYKGERLVSKIYSAESIEDAHKSLKSVEINTIIIDPISLGVSSASEFIFSIRRNMRNLIFVLYSNSDQVHEIEDEYYRGERFRFHHYYRLNKKSKGEKLEYKTFHVVHLCLAELRLLRHQNQTLRGGLPTPDNIKIPLEEFRHRMFGINRKAFVIMRFDNDQANERIYGAIKETLDKHGFFAIRADEYEFSTDLMSNVQTLMHGCDIGIAVFDRVSSDDFNPNVSYEAGYMMALQKPMCILKEKGLKKLPTDLIGKLYNEFNSHEAMVTIDYAISRWLGRKFYKYYGRQDGA